MNRLRLITILSILTIGQLSFAQDPNFSQFAVNPHQFNPAQIGVYEGDFRAGVYYREQWNTILDNNAFRTISANADMRLPVLKEDYIAVGFSFLHDQVGTSNFTQDRAYLAASYLKRLSRSRYKGGSQFLNIGGQFGYGINSFKGGDLWFSRQFDGNIQDINLTIPSGERLNFNDFASPSFLDVNVGLLWFATFDKNQSIYIGGAAHHLTAPNVSFSEDGNFPLERRYVVQIGGEIPVGRRNNVTLLPQGMGMLQGSAMNIIGGSNIRFTNKEWREVALRLGLFGHVVNKLESGVLFQALILTTTLETETFNIGLSYDINTSGLSRATNARGAFELTMIYKHPAKARRSRVDCPKF